MVSYIHSLYAGNGMVAGDTGSLLNNRVGQRNRLLMHRVAKCLSLRRADAINRR